MYLAVLLLQWVDIWLFIGLGVSGVLFVCFPLTKILGKNIFLCPDTRVSLTLGPVTKACD